MIPEYYSISCINPSGPVEEKKKNSQNRFHGIAAWNSWVVAAPSDKSLFLIQLNKGELKSTKIQMPAQLPAERIKILDLAIYATDFTVELFVCCQGSTNQNTNQSTVQVHEFKYTNVQNIDDIKAENQCHTKLFEHERNDPTTGENTRKAKISLGYDKNPFHSSDAKVVRVYSSSKKDIWFGDLDGRTNRKNGSKIRIPRNDDKMIISIAISPHDKNRIAIAYEEKYELIQHRDTVNRVAYSFEDKSSPKSRIEGFEWHARQWKNGETLAWHPFNPDWFCTVKSKANDSSSTVCIFDYQKLSTKQRNNKNIDRLDHIQEKSILWQSETSSGQWTTLQNCKQNVWRPGESNKYQMFSLQNAVPTSNREGAIYLWDIRRPYHAVAVFKLNLSRQKIEIEKELEKDDELESSQGDWIASFTVSNDGKSMFGITSDGFVHFFDLSITNDDLYTRIDMPLQAVAISPLGDLIYSSSLRSADEVNVPTTKRQRSTSAGASHVSKINSEYSRRTKLDWNQIDDRVFRPSSESNRLDRDYDYNWSSQDELTPTTDGSDAFVRLRRFDLFHKNIGFPGELKLAHEIFSDRIYTSLLEEAKHVAEKATQLCLSDWDYYQDIVRFLEMGTESIKAPLVTEIDIESSDNNTGSLEDTICSDHEENLSPIQDEDEDLAKELGQSESGWEGNRHDPSMYQSRNSHLMRHCRLRESPVELRRISVHYSSDDSDVEKSDGSCRDANPSKNQAGLSWQGENSEIFNFKPNPLIEKKSVLMYNDYKLSQCAKDIILLGQDGNIQGAVVGMCLLRECNIIEKIINVQETVSLHPITVKVLEGWFFDYLDLISGICLFTHRAQVIKLSPLDNIRKLFFTGPQSSSSSSVTYKVACGDCKKTFKPPFCVTPKCQSVMVCVICKLPLQTLMKYCKFCGHAGHIDHLNEWFATELECPQPDCDCTCAL